MSVTGAWRILHQTQPHFRTVLRHEIPTPALLIDLDAFEWNLAKMSRHLEARRLGFRPHAKTHKCPAIARRLLDAGARGICVAKLSEAEVFAAAGIRGLVVTTAIIGPGKIARAAQLLQLAPDTILSVDDPGNVREISKVASSTGVVIPLAVDLYFGRTGIAPGKAACHLAGLIASLSHVRFAGLQAYDASASHTHPFEARTARTHETMAAAVETRRMIERTGLPCPMLSCGSTGTFNIDADLDGITELQPGSFLFMDMDYGRIGGPAGDTFDEFRHALTVITTVVSRHGDAAIVDGGYKAFSTDRPFTPQPVDLEGVTYTWAGDEHGRLDLSRAGRSINVGDRVEFIPPHCDPTVNLYDQFYALRGDRVEDVWAIAARGKSQ